MQLDIGSSRSRPACKCNVQPRRSSGGAGSFLIASRCPALPPPLKGCVYPTYVGDRQQDRGSHRSDCDPIAIFNRSAHEGHNGLADEEMREIDRVRQLTKPRVETAAAEHIEQCRQSNCDQQIEFVIVQTVDELLNENHADEERTYGQRKRKTRETAGFQIRVSAMAQCPRQKQPDFKWEKAIGEAGAIKSVCRSPRTQQVSCNNDAHQHEPMSPD